MRLEIAGACRAAGRRAEDVTLVAVSKTFGIDAIAPIIAAGQHVFGENRVQEASSKWPALRDRHPGLELHLIGPLQSNKAREAVGLFDAIHSIDRPSVCAAVAKEIEKQGRSPVLFVQVNTGAEPQKAGVLPQDADAFVAACRDSFGLAIAGLMCIPPRRRAAGAALRSHRQDRGAQRTAAAVHGDERGFPASPSSSAPPMCGSEAPYSGTGRESFPLSRLRGRVREGARAVWETGDKDELADPLPRPSSASGRGVPPHLRHQASGMNHDSRVWSEPPQQALQGGHRHGDAAGRRGEARPGHMNEHGAAAAGDPGPRVVVDFDDEVVERIAAGQAVAGGAGQEADRLVVAAV